MLADLPTFVQKKIKDLLLENNFVKAKQIYDQWSRQAKFNHHLRKPH